MFNPTVFPLCVLPNGDKVDVCVGRLVALDGNTRAHVGIEVKGFPQEKIHRGVTCSNWCLQRTCRQWNHSPLFDPWTATFGGTVMAGISCFIMPAASGYYIFMTWNFLLLTLLLNDWHEGNLDHISILHAVLVAWIYSRWFLMCLCLCCRRRQEWI